MTDAREKQSLRQLRAQAQRFYNAKDLARFGRGDLSQWASLVEQLARHTEQPHPLILELGAGRTKWGNLPGSHIALDISLLSLQQKTNPSVQADMQRLPFANNSVNFIFSIAALEHVPFPELALLEILRVLALESKALLAPAWFCRPWAAKGLPIKSYDELSWPDKIAKASLVIRENILFRALGILPRRLWRELRWLLCRGPQPFSYRRLQPNLNEYVMSDSDAFTSMDPHAATLFFLSRGLHVDHSSFWQRVLGRYYSITVSKLTAQEKHL